MADQDGRPLEVVTLPMPRPSSRATGQRLPASYANFYVGNGVVVVPDLRSRERREGAAGSSGAASRARDVVGIRCEQVVEGLGALHCLSHQLPA